MSNQVTKLKMIRNSVMDLFLVSIVSIAIT